jgi:AraC-like DNA-binding protein
LAQLFAGMKVDTYPPGRLECRGAWAMDFPKTPYVRFAAVLDGECWLKVADQAPERVRQGDGYILTRGLPYRLYSSESAPVADGLKVFRRTSNAVVHHGETSGALTIIVGGRFTFSELMSQVLLESLPPFVRIPSQTGRDAAVLASCTDLLIQEPSDNRLGANLIRHHVAQIMLVQALRARVENSEEIAGGWLQAMSDPRIATAVQMLHTSPEHAWTVEELAKAAGMSRSAFAARFKELAGEPPLEYLLQLRMRLAAHYLATRTRSVSTIAFDLGYQSVSAFSTSFHRVLGVSPKDYRARL